MANHIPAGWPNDSLAGSDSEEPGDKPRLKVETKVSVELHLDEQGNHCSERAPDQESGGPPRPAGALPNPPPEQRKGALGVARGPRCSGKLGDQETSQLGRGTEAGPFGGGGGIRLGSSAGGGGAECREGGAECRRGQCRCVVGPSWR